MTKRVHRSAVDNKYHVGGKAYPHLVGSRKQVFGGFAYKTAGELTKEDLVSNDQGRFVSRRKHLSATKEMRLRKYGYTARRGKFGSVKMTAVQKTSPSSASSSKGGSGFKPLVPKPSSDEAKAAARLENSSNVEYSRRRSPRRPGPPTDEDKYMNEHFPEETRDQVARIQRLIAGVNKGNKK